MTEAWLVLLASPPAGGSSVEHGEALLLARLEDGEILCWRERERENTRSLKSEPQLHSFNPSSAHALVPVPRHGGGRAPPPPRRPLFPPAGSPASSSTHQPPRPLRGAVPAPPPHLDRGRERVGRARLRMIHFFETVYGRGLDSVTLVTRTPPPPSPPALRRGTNVSDQKRG